MRNHSKESVRLDKPEVVMDLVEHGESGMMSSLSEGWPRECFQHGDLHCQYGDIDSEYTLLLCAGPSRVFYKGCQCRGPTRCSYILQKWRDERFVGFGFNSWMLM